MKCEKVTGYLFKLSILVLAWLMVLRIVPADTLSWGIFAFFCVITLSVIGTETKTSRKE